MIPFPPLNLPTPALRLRKTADGRPQVYDELRKRFVTLTAEAVSYTHLTLPTNREV